MFINGRHYSPRVKTFRVLDGNGCVRFIERVCYFADYEDVDEPKTNQLQHEFVAMLQSEPQKVEVSNSVSA